MSGDELLFVPRNELHSVVVVMPGSATGFCYKMLCFLARLFVFWFSIDRCSLSYATYNRLTCALITAVFANASLHCYIRLTVLRALSDFLLLFTAVHRLCFKFTTK